MWTNHSSDAQVLRVQVSWFQREMLTVQDMLSRPVQRDLRRLFRSPGA
jgi:hypothetical protein